MTFDGIEAKEGIYWATASDNTCYIFHSTSTSLETKMATPSRYGVALR
jgi:hypothetical protein